MTTIKYIFSSILILSIFFSSNGFTIGEQQISDDDFNAVKNIDWELLVRDRLKLEIYYLSFDILTNSPLKEKDLINGLYSYKAVVNTRILSHNIEKLRQLSEAKLLKLDNQTSVDIRAYIEFSTDSKKILTYSLEGSGEYMLVNGIKVKSVKFYYDFILNFLPNCEVERYNRILESEIVQHHF
ncbi:MAG: hypothetical protein GXY86_11330 [Firmicutes bacterium]|nr:hypothetical protein [Bacillota bacterium]